ncbi:CatA-like O-acetyltransferase [Gordonibacter sp.]|uniref:CatA-like O-acetyltransferase n=1 Tax=Gordonibacter sp. TaxID=1968902 RepID=UPI001F88D72E|nr:CatA-like O-acetyltransferase [Gordonibacter sp.]HIW75923.1 hypothetical protein [Candidatus Gordonibacter avicola]
MNDDSLIVIDVDQWDRKSHYEWFNQFANPCFSVGKRMDITELLKFCLTNKLSSFATIMYIACCVLNSSESFSLRILNDQVVRVNDANASFTSAINETLFKNCRVKSNLSLFDFCRAVREEGAVLADEVDSKKDFNDIAIVDDIYFSCLPWLDFEYVIQPIPDMSIENKSIPRVTWGKYSDAGNRKEMTMDLTANHALVDGKDAAIAFERIQHYFDRPELLV